MGQGLFCGAVPRLVSAPGGHWTHCARRTVTGSRSVAVACRERWWRTKALFHRPPARFHCCRHGGRTRLRCHEPAHDRHASCHESLQPSACGRIALSGNAIWQFWLALLLVGIGWSFMYTAATAMLTETYTPAERAKTQ